MKTYIALLRGINIGGRNKLPMKELRKLLGKLGLEKVKTYIQSGNVVFEYGDGDLDALGTRISAEIDRSHGFSPRVFILPLEQLQKVMDANPFSEAEARPRFLHVLFLNTIPETPDLQTLREIRTESERFELKGDAFYLHAPDGVGRSRLASRAERLLGVPATGRNWRTLTKIMEMARG